MADTKHKAYGTNASALTTELNSIANNANTAASGAIDNGTNLDLFMDVELVLATQGTARVAGATVTIYAVYAPDGTNYGDVHETTALPLVTFILDAATTARRIVVTDVPMPPGLFKLFARNQTGQTLASSGNTVKYRPHSIATT